MIPKPGKAPHNIAKKWRPISLLSCISKGLERLLARRVARAAIAYSIIPAQYFSALPKRSSTDLVACLVHDIEKALAKDKIAALITLDVSGAFDIVLCKRLIYRLRQQGWPTSFIKWSFSFITGRTVTIRTTEGETLPEISLSCGTPQGSPISPIIFMLYLSPLLRLGEEDRRFGYADDVATLATGTTAASAAQRLQKEIDLSLSWGAANMISFDPAKAELILFYRKDEQVLDFPTILLGDTPIKLQNTIRWLGVFLDSKLTFKRHVRNWSSKALQAANFLRSLNKTRKGSPPDAVAQAAKAVVLSTTLFRAEAWYTGPTKSSWSVKNCKTVRAGDNGLLKEIAASLKAAAQAVLPVWRITAIPILHRESGIPPARVLLNQVRLRQAARIANLHPRHPIVKRIEARGCYRSRLQTLADLAPKCKRPYILPH